MIDEDLIIFFGKCGSGKSSLMVHFADEYVKGQGAGRWELSEQIIREMNVERKTHLEYPEDMPIYINRGFKDKLILKNRFGREVNTIPVIGQDIGINTEDDNGYKYFYPASLFMIDEAHSEFKSKGENLPKGQRTFFNERRHARLKIMLAAPRAVLIHKDIRSSGAYGVEVCGMRKEYSRFGTLISSKWFCREFTDESDLELYIKTDGNEGAYIETEYEHRGNIFALYNSFAFSKDFAPPEGKEFYK